MSLRTLQQFINCLADEGIGKQSVQFLIDNPNKKFTAVRLCMEIGCVISARNIQTIREFIMSLNSDDIHYSDESRTFYYEKVYCQSCGLRFYQNTDKILCRQCDIV